MNVAIIFIFASAILFAFSAQARELDESEIPDDVEYYTSDGHNWKRNSKYNPANDKVISFQLSC